MRSTPARLSFGQERLWFLEHLEEIGSTHHLAFSERFQGALDVSALRRSFENLIERHEILRTVFRQEGEECHSLVLASSTSCPRFIDLSQARGAAGHNRLQAWIRNEIEQRFDLETGPLIRATLVTLSPTDHLLLVVLHHIIMDGISVWLFRRQLLAEYRATSTGGPPDPPQAARPFAELAQAERRALVPEWRASLLDYWRRQLAGLPRTLNLTTDRQRPGRFAFRANAVQLMLPGPMTRALRGLSRREGVSLFVTLLAAYQTLLMRLSGEQDVVVGAPFVGRTIAGSRHALGLFGNTLPLRSDLSGNPSFQDLLRQLRTTVFDAFAHQELPLQILVEELVQTRDPSIPPLFQVSFRLLHVNEEGFEVEGLGRSFSDLHSGGSAHDLALMLQVEDDRIVGRLEYVTALFDRSTAERIAGRFKWLLEGLCSDPRQHLWQFPCTSPAEEGWLIQASSGVGAPYPERTVHDLFERQTRCRPETIVLVAGRQAISFKQLGARADKLARALRSQGSGPGSIVAVALPRGIDLIASLLAILKTGAAYLPLEATDPEARLRHLITLGAVAGVIVAKFGRGWSTNVSNRCRVPLFCPEELTAMGESMASGAKLGRTGESVGPDNLACVMSTSGSSGETMLVEVSHRAIVSLLFGTNYIRFGGQETFLQLAPTSFDASTFEIWGALLHGGRCVLFEGDFPRFDNLEACLLTHAISTLWLTSSLFNAIVDERPRMLAALSQLVTGGEALSAEHVRRALRLFPNIKIVNGYGPTEATTFTCCHRIPAFFSPASHSVPIGPPIANRRVYVLDQNLTFSPIGIEGELYIAGDGLGRGYRHKARETAKSFAPNPFSEVASCRMYQSGDRARRRADGQLDFLGRTDRQLKLRGFRVDPSEIENCLMCRDEVAKARVVPTRDGSGEKRLIAYFTPAPGYSASPDNIRADLPRFLPAYMVPARLIELPALPLTARGKLELTALPAPGTPPAPDTAARFTPSPLRQEVSSTLAELFSALLDQPNVGETDDFFDLGGHSLLALRLLNQIRDVLGVQLHLHVLFENPTVSLLTEAILRCESGPKTAPLISLRSDCSGWPLFGVCGVYGHAFRLLMLARELTVQVPFHALQPPSMSWAKIPCTRFEEMADYYVSQILRVQPTGPVRLLGSSFGGVMIFEIACRLQNLGRAVELLALIDTMPPVEEDPAEWQELAEELAKNRARLGPEADPVELRGLEVARTQLDALQAYRPRQCFRGSMVYFLHTKWGFPGLQDRRFIWRNYASDGLRVLTIGGLHGSFCTQPVRRHIVEHLDTLLAVGSISTLSMTEYCAKRLGYRILRPAGDEILALPGGGELPIRSRENQAGENGRVEEVAHIRNRVWLKCQAIEPGRKKPARALIIFSGNKAVRAARPLRQAAENKHPGASSNGHGFSCLVDILHPAEPSNTRLRVIAVGQDCAWDLPILDTRRP